ncbi:hypothetical protein [uncultured Croceitalea sp.]|uniref:hypothetical protein n=1 Tax=uncultured Croceitalea sp. TaxID=1798908 RepID=UPI0033068211
MAKRFEIGDVVCAKVSPSIVLVVRLYARKIYYCTLQNQPNANEQVYFERELKPYEGSTITSDN